ncbi:MAG TPA: polymer-forming cytoskeletal protein [Thermoanaerobaculia bacterium]|nr:polymer-forming cytoskeletal protein [Thermoanaerobaculia bacterium]
MALFRRDEPETARGPQADSSRPTRQEPESAPRTVIAPGSRLQGTISGTVDVMVEGVLDGRAELEATLVVGLGGRVEGDIKARVVRIAGSVAGNIEAVERVEVTPSGHIEGDIVAPRVAIAEGGFCQGRIEMTKARGPAAGRSKAEEDEPAKPAPAGSAPSRQAALEGLGANG